MSHRLYLIRSRNFANLLNVSEHPRSDPKPPNGRSQTHSSHKSNTATLGLDTSNLKAQQSSKLEVEEPGHGNPERSHGLIHLSIRNSGTFITDTGSRFRRDLRDLDGVPKLSDPSFDQRNQGFGMGTPVHKTRHLGDLGRKRKFLFLRLVS
ncbi:hypothetical protein F2Q69_00047499 [Brassica cretica]|uniref:Uncharacterized protein n=1 Tax=Brassica cretica TaxID=69181 RepID=A0A8S9PR86_BRACR|nr:hypothetical protein F2Q69_00047499 [Brassica cretica]